MKAFLKKILKRTSFYKSYAEKKRNEKRGEHWCRVVMNQSTKKLVEQLDKKSISTLEISGSSWESYGFSSYTNVEYPDFDICKQVLDQKFDLIIAEQVFEHLMYPYRAGKNVFDMLNPGGYFLITTPFMIKVHNFPIDCSRWTPTGMKFFLNECGFGLEQIVVNSWGNKECVIANLDKWVPYKDKQSLLNEDEFPLVVWALAKK